MILKVGYASVQYSDSVAHEATTNSIDCRRNSKLCANRDWRNNWTGGFSLQQI